jgi:hypothetical protein
MGLESRQDALSGDLPDWLRKGEIVDPALSHLLSFTRLMLSFATRNFSIHQIYQ